MIIATLVKTAYEGSITTPCIMFAKWCSLNMLHFPIRAAINARLLMNGDLSRITADTPDADVDVDPDTTIM
ncbi:hypothetical protein N7449_011312 [Penicillium cf. viridicatum]|uniref:Uncharacterized protein n=1 Tax=Penicillium cf. viridicatum TaxID=2972119 RepID=A0A9W9M2H2_9EURO|nr:hypothetical protein N7449_011312 [Penicillium cf. viridicatum]